MRVPLGRVQASDGGAQLRFDRGLLSVGLAALLAQHGRLAEDRLALLLAVTAAALLAGALLGGLAVRRGGDGRARLLACLNGGLAVLILANTALQASFA